LITKLVVTGAAGEKFVLPTWDAVKVTVPTPNIVILLLLRLTSPGGEVSMVTGRPELATGYWKPNGVILKGRLATG
jgi:hypothetical protein